MALITKYDIAIRYGKQEWVNVNYVDPIWKYQMILNNAGPYILKCTPRAENPNNLIKDSTIAPVVLNLFNKITKLNLTLKIPAFLQAILFIVEPKINWWS